MSLDQTQLIRKLRDSLEEQVDFWKNENGCDDEEIKGAIDEWFDNLKDEIVTKIII